MLDHAPAAQAPLHEFERLVATARAERLDLMQAALLIAQTEYPHLATGRYLTRIAALADRVQRRLPPVADPEQTVAALNAVLFGEAGLRGNRDDYFDPRTSFVNQVLDRG